MRLSLLVGVCAAAFTAPTALAQQAEQPSSERVSEQSRDVVVVTATRREQNLVEVPVAISNFGAEDLARTGAREVRQIANLTPSFSFTSSVSESYGANIRIRGVGTSGSNPGLESATGVYVDGVYRSRSGLAANDLPGVERIELLRGPQGTLFGKNTTAGVVNVITKRPTFSPFAEAEASAGNYNFLEGKATLNGPLAGDWLAGRLDLLVQSRDGLIDDYVNGREFYNRDRYQLRGQLLMDDGGPFDLRIIADYTDRDEAPGNAIPYRTAVTTSGAYAALNALGGVPRVAFDANDTGRVVSQSNGNYFDRGSDMGISAEANWNVGFANVTSITAYRDWESDRSYDVEGNVLDLLNDPFDGERYRTITQEVRLQGESGPLDYLVGFYVADEKVVSRDSYQFGADLDTYLSTLTGGTNFSTYTGQPVGQSFRAGAQASLDRHEQDGFSYAFFTHNTYDLTDTITLTGGLRYSVEEKDLNSTLVSDNPACAGAIALHGPNLSTVPSGLRGLLCVPNFDTRLDGTYSDSKSEKEWSGTTSISWQPTPDLNIYAGYSRGYKAGGYNLDRAGLAYPNPDGSNLRFQPEFADSYEIGLKAILLDGALMSNWAVYHTEVSDYQYTYNLLLPSGVPQRVTTNLPALLSTGIEVENRYEVTDDLTLGLNVTNQDVRFDDSAFPAGLTQLQGTRAPNAPAWTVTASANYDGQIPGTNLTWFAYGDVRHQTETNVSSSGATTSDYIQDGYAIVNARLGLGDADEHWAVEVWARNLFDEAAWTQLVPATLQSGLIYGYLNEPQMFGLTLKVKQ